MKIDKANVEAGNQVKGYLEREQHGFSTTVLERAGNLIRIEIIKWNEQHKRDLWISIDNVRSCTKSDIDENTKAVIMKELKNRFRVFSLYKN